MVNRASYGSPVILVVMVVFLWSCFYCIVNGRRRSDIYLKAPRNVCSQANPPRILNPQTIIADLSMGRRSSLECDG